MPDMFELVQKHYFHEVERRAELNRALTVPLALVTALLTASLTFLRAVSPPFWWAEVALLILCSPVILCLLVAITNLARSSIGYVYDHPCDAGTLMDWRAKVIANGNSTLKADEEAWELMLTEYSECSKVNTLNNDSKSAYLHTASEYIVSALCFLIVAAVPYLVVTAAGGQQPHAVLTNGG